MFIFSDEKSKTEKISIICKRQKMKRVKQINVNNLSKVSQLFNYSINVSIARTNEFLQQISRNILDLAKAQDKHTFFLLFMKLNEMIVYGVCIHVCVCMHTHISVTKRTQYYSDFLPHPGFGIL